MFHFFARLGRRPATKYVLPVITGIATVGYYSCHSVLHNQVRDFFAAQSPDGRREEISESLRELVKRTYVDVHQSSNFMKPVISFPNEFFNPGPPPIKWFASSTLEPITFGTTDSKTGVLIGLPSYYNYEKAADLPANVFEIRQLRLFRSPQDKELEIKELKEIRELAGVASDGNETVRIKTIDRDSAEGQEYIESMLLSEEAKKFSVARELFMGDSYRPLTKSATIILSSSLALQTARLSVVLLKLAGAHLSNRLPGYMLSGVLGYGTFLFLNTALDDYYAKESDKRAKNLGEAYERGAKEYYSKRTRRRMILGLE